MKAVRTILFAALAACSSGAAGHGDSAHAGKPRPLSTEESAFGREGDPRKVTRTIDVAMSDAMRFTPSRISIRQGDTVRFRVTNSGKVMHEMVLGTLPALEAHAALMRKHPGMEHDEPHMAHVAAGRTQSLVWQFTRPGEFHYGCLVPGHFEAGMKGTIIVTKGDVK